MIETISRGVSSILLAGAYGKDYLGGKISRSGFVAEPIQTLKGCALKAAVGGLFALAVGANPVGCATAAVGYVAVKRGIYFGKSLGKSFPLGKPFGELLVGGSAYYGTGVLLGCGTLSVPALLAFAVFNRTLLSDIIDCVGGVVGCRYLSYNRVSRLLLDSVISGTAAYVTCSKIAAVVAFKIGLSASLVASMPVSLAFGVTMVATTLVAKVAMDLLAKNLSPKDDKGSSYILSKHMRTVSLKDLTEDVTRGAKFFRSYA